MEYVYIASGRCFFCLLLFIIWVFRKIFLVSSSHSHLMAKTTAKLSVFERMSHTSTMVSATSYTSLWHIIVWEFHLSKRFTLRLCRNEHTSVHVHTKDKNRQAQQSHRLCTNYIPFVILMLTCIRKMLQRRLYSVKHFEIYGMYAIRSRREKNNSNVQ